MLTPPPLEKIARQPSADGPGLITTKVGSVTISLHWHLVPAKIARDRAVLK
jgi:hypothetical protein